MLTHTLLCDFTVSSARQHLNRLDGVFRPFPWESQTVTHLGTPLPDIWHCFTSKQLPFRLKETLYKFVLNVLPLGACLHHVPAEEQVCHFCPGVRQTL